MELIDRELKITRYTDGAMLPEEKSSFLAEAQADPKLREVLAAENAIQTILRRDAENIEQNEIFDTMPGAPLVERLAATAVSSNRKMIYIICGAAILLALLFFTFFRSEPTAQNPVPSLVPKHIERSAPTGIPPSRPADLRSEEHLRIRTEALKDSARVQTPSKRTKDIDLDQDLKGIPKVFTDPKGHMLIK